MFLICLHNVCNTREDIYHVGCLQTGSVFQGVHTALQHLLHVCVAKRGGTQASAYLTVALCTLHALTLLSALAAYAIIACSAALIMQPCSSPPFTCTLKALCVAVPHCYCRYVIKLSQVPANHSIVSGVHETLVRAQACSSLCGISFPTLCCLPGAEAVGLCSIQACTPHQDHGADWQGQERAQRCTGWHRGGDIQH